MLALQATTGRASLLTRLVRLLCAIRFRSLLRSVRCRAADVSVRLGARPAVLVPTPVQATAITALRTGIDPNVEAGADLARRIPVAVCIRFAVRAALPAMTRSGLL